MGSTTRECANVKTARTFLDAWARSDASFRDRLDPDVSLETPMTSLSGRDDVAEAMAEFSRLVSSIDIICIAGDGANVLAMYDMRTVQFGVIRAAEHYRFVDGRIVSDQLVFDASRLERGASS